MKYWQRLVAMGLIVGLGSLMQFWLWSWFPTVGICVTLAYLVGVSTARDKAGWEQHPCVMPKIVEVMGAKGRVWACHCGRRWKFLRKERVPYSEMVNHLWMEWTPEMELAEAEEKLRKMGISGTPLPSTLDVIERDR